MGATFYTMALKSNIYIYIYIYIYIKYNFHTGKVLELGFPKCF